MPSYTLGIGMGLSEPCAPYRTANVFGADLNTPNASGWNCAPALVGSTTSFNLSTISKNQEVVVALLSVSAANAGNHTIRFRWYRDRDDKLLFDYSFNYPALKGGWFYAYSFIGWTSWEINENGTYRVEVVVAGAGSFSRVIYFSILGITAEVPVPPPAPAPATGIVGALSSISSYFYLLYVNTQPWIYPFNYVAVPFYWLYILFNTLAVAFGDFITLVNALIARVANILSWDTIWSFILGYVPNLVAIRDWFYSWYSTVLQLVNSWWSVASVTVHGWIDVAIQGIGGIVTAWDGFWNNLWPQLVSRFDSLKSAWDNFWTYTLPGLVSFTWLTTWWNSRLQDVQGLINSAFSTRQSLWTGWQDMRSNVVTFFQDPVEFIWQRFADWFLGPEE